MRRKGNEKRNRELAATLGATIRRLREKQGLSLEGLAHAAKLDKGQLGRIERGEAETSVGGWWDIATALGLTLGELFTLAFGKRMRRAPRPEEDCTTHP